MQKAQTVEKGSGNLRAEEETLHHATTVEVMRLSYADDKQMIIESFEEKKDPR